MITLETSTYWSTYVRLLSEIKVLLSMGGFSASRQNTHQRLWHPSRESARRDYPLATRYWGSLSLLKQHVHKGNSPSLGTDGCTMSAQLSQQASASTTIGASQPNLGEATQSMAVKAAFTGCAQGNAPALEWVISWLSSWVNTPGARNDKQSESRRKQ